MSNQGIQIADCLMQNPEHLLSYQYYLSLQVLTVRKPQYSSKSSSLPLIPSIA